MSDILTKIGEYQVALHKKLGVSLYAIPEEKQIEISNYVMIDGIYLGDNDDKNWFVDVYFTDSKLHYAFSLYTFSDSILHQIAHILRSEI